jgi:lipoprotein-releasing system permease protein
LNFLFAWRYFKSKKTTNAINIIAWISVVAIMVGTASLIVLLSVFNGFEGLVQSLYASFYTDVKVTAVQGKTVLLSNQQLKQIAATPGVRSYSLVMEEKALLQNGDYQSIVYLKGVDDNYKKVAGVPNAMLRGKFNTGTAQQPFAILGGGIENTLNVQSDRNLLPLTIYLPKKGLSVNVADPLQSLSSASINTAGAFAIQQDFDNKYVLTNLAFIKEMLGLQPNEYGGVEIAVNNIRDEKKVKQLLQNLLGNKYQVLTRYEQNKSLYAIMQTEKWVIYAILSLILVVAAFTMIGSLTMLVLEKQKDIQILKALGMRNNKVQNIFLSEGLLLAIVGGGSGVLLALLICWLQVTFNIVPLQGGTFIINSYPVKVKPADILLVLFTVFLVAVLAAWLPGKRAAAQPVELR